MPRVFLSAGLRRPSLVPLLLSPTSLKYIYWHPIPVPVPVVVATSPSIPNPPLPPLSLRTPNGSYTGVCVSNTPDAHPSSLFANYHSDAGTKLILDWQAGYWQLRTIASKDTRSPRAERRRRQCTTVVSRRVDRPRDRGGRF